MATTEQQNGNPCTNETRNTFNRRVSKYSMLGKTKKYNGAIEEDIATFKKHAEYLSR